MQNEIKTESSVLNQDGTIKTSGWSRLPLFTFDKSLCKNKLSIYERDSYVIANDEVTIYLSVMQRGLTSEVTAVIADHNKGTIDARTLKKYMSFGRVDMPSSSKNGDVTFTDARVGMNFSNTALRRYIRCEFVNFCKDKNLYINVMLEDTIQESLNTLIPTKHNRRGFLLKRFMPSMRASGVVRCGGAEYNFSADNTYAFLDWQRFSTKDKAYYHALYADSEIESRQFSLCLAGGHGDHSQVTENCYFHDGIIHKFASVKAEGNEERPDKPWHFTAGSNAMDIIFRPEIKGGRLMSHKCGQKIIIFGKIYGTIHQLDKEKITIDAVPAHLEFTLI